MKSNYDIARKRVKKKLEFRSHLVSYLVIMGFLLVLNILTTSYLWVIWPALGWGLGLAFHGFEAYGIIADKDKEEEMIEKELDRMDRKELSAGEQESLEDDQLELRDIRKEKAPRYNEDDFV